MQSQQATHTVCSVLPLSGIPCALWTGRPCKDCWLSLFIVIYWSQLWGQAGSGSKNSSISLLKGRFCGQAKTSGVILDSSNSFVPHVQTASKSCKLYFEHASCIWLLLANPTGMTLALPPTPTNFTAMAPKHTPGFCARRPSSHPQSSSQWDSILV